MICNICSKNQATVHLTEIVNEQMTELHLCEQCAQAKSHEMEQQFGLNDLLKGLVDFEKPSAEKETLLIKCSSCGLTYADFKKIGRLGCGQCYVTFKKYLAPLLKRIHGSNCHTGKSPLKSHGPCKKKEDLQELRLSLQKAIENEDFEKAAQLRDAIRELEKVKFQTDASNEGGKNAD
jgi:protein arginine kinase activator